MTINDLDYYPDFKDKTFPTSMFCSSKQLTSLEGSPKYVNGDCDISKNYLTTLKYCPEKVKGNFYCGENQLETLEYRPKIIDGILNCRNNNIKKIKNQVIKYGIIAKSYTTDEGFFTFENIKTEFDENVKLMKKEEELKKEKSKQQNNNKLNYDYGI